MRQSQLTHCYDLIQRAPLGSKCQPEWKYMFQAWSAKALGLTPVILIKWNYSMEQFLIRQPTQCVHHTGHKTLVLSGKTLWFWLNSEDICHCLKLWCHVWIRSVVVNYCISDRKLSHVQEMPWIASYIRSDDKILYVSVTWRMEMLCGIFQSKYKSSALNPSIPLPQSTNFCFLYAFPLLIKFKIM